MKRERKNDNYPQEALVNMYRSKVKRNRAKNKLSIYLYTKYICSEFGSMDTSEYWRLLYTNRHETRMYVPSTLL